MNNLKFLILFLAFSLVGCQQNIKLDQLNVLSGYWEIEKVILVNGETKAFNVNTTIDYFEVNLAQKEGIRKKVAPQLDGTFVTFPQNESFKIIETNNQMLLAYKTPYDEWQEEILSISNKQIVLKNNEGNTYYYKPYQPLNIN